MRLTPELIKACAMCTDALAALRAEQKRADREYGSTPPGSIEERYALRIGRMVKHLGDAISDVPTEIWIAMCNANPDAVKTSKAA